MKTLNDYIYEAATNSDTKVSFWESEDKIISYSYRQILDKSSVVADNLQRLGLKKNDRIAILLPTHPNFYFIFLGGILSGGISVALYPPVRLGKIQRWKLETTEMISQIEASIIITNKQLYNFLGEITTLSDPSLGCHCIEDLLTGNDKNFRHTNNANDNAIIQFSSGTTGKSKPVLLTHKNVVGNVKSIHKTYPKELRDNFIGVSWLPLYHDMGLIGCLFNTLILAADVTYIRPEKFLSQPKTWFEAMNKTKANGTVAPNFAYGYCVDKIPKEEVRNWDLSSLRIALCGAEPVHPNTMKNFATHFAESNLNKNVLTPVYGLAEATLAVSFSRFENEPIYKLFDKDELEKNKRAILSSSGVELASVGKPIENTEIKIRNESLNELADGHLGQIWVKGVGVMKEYYKNKFETDKILHDGWLNTGDLGFIYEEDLFIYGRSKEILIINGKNFSPTAIENSFTTIKELRAGCSAAFSHHLNSNDNTESLVILAEVKKNLKPNTDDLRLKIYNNVLENFNMKASIIDLLPAGSLPRTSSGKIKRLEARKMWLENQIHSGDKNPWWSVIKENIKGLMYHYKNRLKR